MLLYSLFRFWRYVNRCSALVDFNTHDSYSVDGAYLRILLESITFLWKLLLQRKPKLIERSSSMLILSLSKYICKLIAVKNMTFAPFANSGVWKPLHYVTLISKDNFPIYSKIIKLAKIKVTLKTHSWAQLARCSAPLANSICRPDV